MSLFRRTRKPKRVYIPESGLGGGYYMEEVSCSCGADCWKFEDGSGGICDSCEKKMKDNKSQSESEAAELYAVAQLLLDQKVD